MSFLGIDYAGFFRAFAKCPQCRFGAIRREGKKMWRGRESPKSVILNRRELAFCVVHSCYCKSRLSVRRSHPGDTFQQRSASNRQLTKDVPALSSDPAVSVL